MTKRLTIICDFPFWRSQVGSHTRVQNLIGELGRQFDLSVVCFGITGKDEQDEGRSATRATLFFPSNPLPKAGEDNQATLVELEAILKDLGPYAVILEYIRLAVLREAIPKGVAVLLDAHDVMSQRSLSFLRHGRTPKIYRTAANEAAELSAFDAVLAISTADAAYMRTVLGLQNIITTPPSRTEALFPSVARSFKPAGSRLTAIFVGGANEPNERGLAALSRIWPVLTPAYDLQIVGLVNAKAVRALPGVQVVGHVADLAELYAQADVALNPVYMGGGLKIKILEALSAGLPCVSSSEGARGLEQAVASRALLVAESLLAFVGHLTVLKNPEARRAISTATSEYAIDSLSAEQVFGPLNQYLRHI